MERNKYYREGTETNRNKLEDPEGAEKRAGRNQEEQRETRKNG